MNLKFGEVVGNGSASFDLDKLLGTRLLIQANSGGGKSYAIRKLLETWFGHVQIIVLDLEGEFSTLREKYDFVLAGKDADFPTNPKTAELLAKKAFELQFSIIIDLYELKEHEKHLYVKTFLDALINSPKALWHPCIVVVDECQYFCPEKGQGESIASESVIGLMSRGRKRGLCGVIATQRLSKLNKNAAAMAVNKLIGLCSIPLDMKQAAFELGLSGQQDTLSLRDLDPGEFFAFGRAISREVVKVKIGKVQTTHYEAGTKITSPPPPTDKIKTMLSKLTDLPQEAEKDEDEKEALKVMVSRMRVRISELEQRDGGITRQQLEESKKKGFEEGSRWQNPLILEMMVYDKKKQAYVKEVSNMMNKILGLKPPVMPEPVKSPPITWSPQKEQTNQKTLLIPQIPMSSDEIDEEKTYNKCERSILNFLLNHSDKSFSKIQTAYATGYSINSGGFKNALSRLKTSGLISVNGEIQVRDSSGVMNALGESYRPLEKVSVEGWTQKLRSLCAKKIYAELLSNPDYLFPLDELAQRTEYSRNSGGFKNAVSSLSSLGLGKREQGGIRLNPELLEI